MDFLGIEKPLRKEGGGTWSEKGDNFKGLRHGTTGVMDSVIPL